MDNSNKNEYYALTFFLVMGGILCSKFVENYFAKDSLPYRVGYSILVALLVVYIQSMYPSGEKFEINPVKSCFGWPYMQQDTEEGNKMCQDLFSTEEGRQLYLKYGGCAKGMYNGEEVDLPDKMGWINQPFSNDNWESPLTEQDMHTTSKYF